jgi:hypothetical protein
LPLREIVRHAPSKVPLDGSTLPCFRGDLKQPKARSLDRHRKAPKQGAKQILFTRGSVSINLEPIRDPWTKPVCQLPFWQCATNELGRHAVSQLEVAYMYLIDEIVDTCSV